MGIVGIIELALSTIGKVADKIPDFPQRKKQELENLINIYNKELVKEQMDTGRMIILSDQILTKYKVFCKEIKGA